MKISGIDKDIENIIYYLDNNGFKTFASCDGVEKNHNDEDKPTNGYISFLKSPKIIDLMAECLKKKEIFTVTLTGNNKPLELYGNIISGTTYSIYFKNNNGENTKYLEDVIEQVVETEECELDNEKKKLLILEKILEEDTNSNIVFEISLNTEYQPHMNKKGKINELRIISEPEETRSENNVNIHRVRDISILANMLCEKYDLKKKKEFESEYPTEFIENGTDKSMCSIYFLDEHFLQIIEQIQHARQVECTLPLVEIKEAVWEEEEFYEEDDIEK